MEILRFSDLFIFPWNELFKYEGKKINLNFLILPSKKFYN